MSRAITITVWAAVYIAGGIVTMAVNSKGIEKSRRKLKEEDYKVREEDRQGADTIDGWIALTYLLYFTFWWYFFVVRSIK